MLHVAKCMQHVTRALIARDDLELHDDDSLISIRLPATLFCTRIGGLITSLLGESRRLASRTESRPG